MKTLIFLSLLIAAASGFAQHIQQNEEWADTCAHLKQWKYYRVSTQEEAKEQRDPLQLYISRCAAIDSLSFQVFTALDGAVQIYNPNDLNRFNDYRDWLISVLYLNKTNPAYFCACLGSIAGTYQIGKYSPLGYLAVMDFVRKHHPECWGPGGDAQFAKDSTIDFQNGYDPTHLPPLDSLGLGFLLDNSSVSSPSYIGAFVTTPNPFISETDIEFSLNRMAYTIVSVYDELGHLLWGESHGASLEAGKHTIHLDASKWESGVYYARISTGFGEVKTVKLVKE